ncbi:DUF2513 domain-containing protein [uncultured Lentilactobacillus sp.]|uniref:DUF2513 domain-containing protein n=1 Tax=uncultured Lentilactobacillus sp. TaxID=2805375 RepID=UPI002593652C|nr:DUF2513 domain-containing protein [uncultured Lentilactobacillus sp.]
MKLKQDCVRYVLLALEEQDLAMFHSGASLSSILNVLTNDKYSRDDISYTLLQLSDGQYINANVNKYVGGFDITVFNITWSGHELLDSIRDDEVWRQTKKATSNLKSVSLGVLKNVATAVLTGIIKQSTGLPI